MMSYNTLVVLLGTSLLGAAAGPIGAFAVLRRKALVGDALAHAALPGLCLAFLLTGEKRQPILLAGAFATGCIGVLVMAFLRRWTRVKEDAALGIVLSVFFGAGVVLSRIAQKHTAGGSKAGLDSYILGKTAGILAQDVYFSGALALFTLAAIVLLLKEFRLVAFDPDFARVQGWPAGWLDLAMTGLVAVAVVIGLPAVGVVLMAALLILPGGAARFWTDRLSRLLLLSCGFGALMGGVGTLLSATLDTLPAGPIIVLVGTSLFAVSATAAPRRGLVAQWWAHRQFQRSLRDHAPPWPEGTEAAP